MPTHPLQNIELNLLTLDESSKGFFTKQMRTKRHASGREFIFYTGVDHSRHPEPPGEIGVWACALRQIHQCIPIKTPLRRLDGTDVDIEGCSHWWGLLTSIKYGVG